MPLLLDKIAPWPAACNGGQFHPYAGNSEKSHVDRREKLAKIINALNFISMANRTNRNLLINHKELNENLDGSKTADLKKGGALRYTFPRLSWQDNAIALLLIYKKYSCLEVRLCPHYYTAILR